MFTELATPMGTITITGKEGRVPFACCKNREIVPYVTETEEEIQPTNSCTVLIPAATLRKKQNYKVLFSGGPLELFSSDETVTAYTATKDSCSIALGVYDPNTMEKERQAEIYSAKVGFRKKGMIVDPPSFDTSLMKGFSAEWLESGMGFEFELLDDSMEYVTFYAAWLQAADIDPITREDAVSFWVL